MEGYKNMIDAPLISVIIPTYNRAHIIGETLDSILAQTYIHWECIVVDDGSTDGTEDLMAEYMERDIRFRYYHRPAERPKGPCSCRNYGFEHSKGAYVNFFDSDDLFKPQAFQQWINSFSQGVDAVISKVDLVDFKTNEIKYTNSFITPDLIADFITGKVTYFVCGPLWRKTFLLKQPYLFDEAIRNVDDWDFNLRMLYEEPKITYLECAHIIYRWHENSFSKLMSKLDVVEVKSDLRARLKHIDLLKKRNQNQYVPVLQKLIVQRFKHYLRKAVVENNGIKFYVLKILIKVQWTLGDLSGSCKTLIGFISYTWFRKGYRLLKE